MGNNSIDMATGVVKGPKGKYSNWGLLVVGEWVSGFVGWNDDSLTVS